MDGQQYGQADGEGFFPESPQGGRLPEKKDRGFAKGVATGAACTLIVMALVAGLVYLPEQVARRKAPGQGEGSTKDAIFQDAVEEKEKEIVDLIDQYYYEDIDENAVVEGMYAGMVEGLGDPYSNYFTAEEYASFNETTTGTYCGIGVVLTQEAKTKAVTILHVYADTPAEEAGLKDGDVISKVGDVEGDSMELTELTSYIKGEEGTTVHLEIVRRGSPGI